MLKSAGKKHHETQAIWTVSNYLSTVDFFVLKGNVVMTAEKPDTIKVSIPVITRVDTVYVLTCYSKKDTSLLRYSGQKTACCC